MSRFSYLSHLRLGAAAFIDQDAAQAPVRFRTSVEMSVSGEPLSIPVTLFGPGDVAGISPAGVSGRAPAPGAVGAEVNYFPHVELAEADLPWRFTPTRGDADQRLLPWLNLIVVEERPGVGISPAQGAQLPAIEVPRGDLPDLAEADLWSHVQVTLPGGSLGQALDEYVRANPHMALARLMSPRRMAPYTAYLACLVPTC